MIYQWKPGAHVSVDAQATGEELEALRVRNNGRLEAADVVDAARAETSAMHDHFEWDDVRAASSWRNEQAGHLIRCITVKIDQAEGAAPTRAFVSV